jgi:hypothetical protein
LLSIASSSRAAVSIAELHANVDDLALWAVVVVGRLIEAA